MDVDVDETMPLRHIEMCQGNKLSLTKSKKMTIHSQLFNDHQQQHPATSSSSSSLAKDNTQAGTAWLYSIIIVYKKIERWMNGRL